MILSIAQIVTAAIVIILILLQERSSGAGGIFGGGEAGYYQTRRGLEKVMFIFTIIAIIAFAGLALLNLIL